MRWYQKIPIKVEKINGGIFLEKKSGKILKNKTILVGLFIGLLVVGTVWASSGGAHWGYEGEDGPANWHTLSPDYALCGSGTEQSPVNIAGFDASSLSDLNLNYKATGGKVLNNGHTLQVSLEPGSTLTVDGEEYDLLQFHFHTVSENTIAGKHYPMEIHFVHKSSAGGLAVISVMVEEGSSNTAIKPIVNLLPTAAGEENVLDEAFNPETLLPSDKSVYRFMGSLTTPPCSEGVKWHVAKEPIGMSKDQIASFAHIMGDNFRPTQREIGAAEGQSGGSTGIAAIVVILLVAAGLVVYLKKK